jgi:O-antigen ligase
MLLGGAIYGLLVTLGLLGYFPTTAAETYTDLDYEVTDIRLARVFSSFEIPLLGPLTLSYNITGALFSIVATLGFGFYIASNKRFERMLGISSAVITGLAMYLMAARAAMLGALCGFSIISALNFKINKVNFKDKILGLFKLIFIITAIFLIFLYLFPLLDPSFYETLMTKVSLSYIVQDESFISRIDFLKYNINFLLKNPLGTGFIRDLSSWGFYGILVHNQFISIAFGTGILGLFMFLCFFWFSTRYIIRSLGSKDHLSTTISICAIGILVCYGINAMFVDTVRKFGPDIFLIMIYAAAIAAINLADKEGLEAK